MCMCAHHMHPWYVQKPEEGVIFPELELHRVVSCPAGAGK